MLPKCGKLSVGVLKVRIIKTETPRAVCRVGVRGRRCHNNLRSSGSAVDLLTVTIVH
jgi:hypothetical protein